ncbi:MAG: hypothetical protein V2J11_06560 [Desulfofustis sp.]|jgi:2-oxo-3-hexenedioate decarboxylase|nr:hypothetical protein [Desulfofustis sp.]
MKNNLNLQSIADEIKLAQDECKQLSLITERYKSFDNADAYAVAEMVHQMRLKEGMVPIGRKIGFTNPKMWSIYGVCEPIWGYIYDTTVIKLTEPSAVRCRIGHFAEPKIEPEVVVHFGSAPSVDANTVEVLASIDWVAHGIEIVQSHFPGWKFKAADTIADWGLHATLIVGKPMYVEQLGKNVLNDLENFTVMLSCDGTMLEQGKGANALGSPIKAVGHLITVLAHQPDATPLQPGELVTTGTLTVALPIHPGQTWRTSLNGIELSDISISFEE